MTIETRIKRRVTQLGPNNKAIFWNLRQQISIHCFMYTIFKRNVLFYVIFPLIFIWSINNHRNNSTRKIELDHKFTIMLQCGFARFACWCTYVALLSFVLPKLVENWDNIFTKFKRNNVLEISILKRLHCYSVDAFTSHTHTDGFTSGTINNLKKYLIWTVDIDFNWNNVLKILIPKMKDAGYLGLVFYSFVFLLSSIKVSEKPFTHKAFHISTAKQRVFQFQKRRKPTQSQPHLVVLMSMGDYDRMIIKVDGSIGGSIKWFTRSNASSFLKKI